MASQFIFKMHFESLDNRGEKLKRKRKLMKLINHAASKLRKLKHFQNYLFHTFLYANPLCYFKFIPYSNFHLKYSIFQLILQLSLYELSRPMFSLEWPDFKFIIIYISVHLCALWTNEISLKPFELATVFRQQQAVHSVKASSKRVQP